MIFGHLKALGGTQRRTFFRSPKQSVVGSTPIGLNPQTSNSFWLMFSRASCQTREEHRLERFFLPGNLLFAPLLALLAAFQHFAFLPTTLLWQTGDLPNIRVHGVPAIFCTQYFLELSVLLCELSIDRITILFSNHLDFLCIELSTLLMPCFAMLDAVRQRSSRVLACKRPAAFDGSKKLCGRFSQSF